MGGIRPAAIGLDVGGTKIAGGLVEIASGRVLVRDEVATRPERGGEPVLEDALALAQKLIREADAIARPIAAIGIGLCELVDQRGVISDEALVRWKDLPVHERFSKLAPTTIDSDARAPAIAEAKYGAGEPYRRFAYVTVGTGISYALVRDGVAETGARGNAMLLGSTPLRTRCDHCGEISTRVLEKFASGPALVSRYNALTQAQLTRGQEVMAALDVGDTVALEVVQSAADALGQSVGFLINLLDPEALIVGGGLGLAGGQYWKTFEASTRRHIYARDTRELPILPARLGVDAGLIGAALGAYGELVQANN